MQCRTLGVAVLAAALTAACAPHSPRPSDGRLEREALAGTERPAPASLPLRDSDAGMTAAKDSETVAALRGTGRFIAPARWRRLARMPRAPVR